MPPVFQPDTITPVRAAEGKYKIGTVAFIAFGDRVLVEEDEFRSGYECKRCSALGAIPCENCGGAGAVSYSPTDIAKKCSVCSGSGRTQCPDCHGKGGLLAVPETSERRPTTGRIVSTGEAVKFLTVGQSILFSSYAGHTVDLYRDGHPVSLRILHESEVLSLVEGHLELRTVRGKSEIAEYQN